MLANYEKTIRNDILTWSSTDQQQIYRDLIANPLTVSTDDLHKIFKPKRHTPDTEQKKEEEEEEKRHRNTAGPIFYFRQFILTVEQAHNVFHDMVLDGWHMNRNLFTWWHLVSSSTMQADEAVYLRYIGQTDRNAWERHISDMYSKTLRTFLDRFMRTAFTKYPEILKAAEVYEFEEARQLLKTPQAVSDMYERAFIALFSEGVLNTAPGGKDSSAAYTHVDKIVFESLRTTTTDRVKNLTQGMPKDAAKNLEEYARSVCNYGNSNETTRRGRKKLHYYTDKTEKMLYQQGAFNACADGCAPLVFLGSDLGDDHEEDEPTFFEAGGRTVDAVTALLNQIGSWEDPTGRKQDSFVQNLVEDHLLPFFDYHPFYAKHAANYHAASDLSYFYMQLAKPYIVVAFGIQVCALIYSFLQRDH